MPLTLPSALSSMKDSATAVTYLVKITGPSTTYRFAFPDGVSDGTNTWSADSVISFSDVGQSIDIEEGGAMFKRRATTLTLVAAGVTLDTYMENAAVEIRVVPYDAVVTLSDSLIRWTGVVSDIRKTRREVTLIFDTDEETRFGKSLPSSVIGLDDYPRSNTDALGTAVPVLYGDWSEDYSALDSTTVDHFGYGRDVVRGKVVDEASPDYAGFKTFLFGASGSNGKGAVWIPNIGEYGNIAASTADSNPGGVPASQGYVMVPYGTTIQVEIPHPPNESTKGYATIDAWWEDDSTSPENAFDRSYIYSATITNGQSSHPQGGVGTDSIAVFSVKFGKITSIPYDTINRVVIKVQFDIQGDNLTGGATEYVKVFLIKISTGGVIASQGNFDTVGDKMVHLDIGSGNYSAVMTNPEDYAIIVAWYLDDVVQANRTNTSAVGIYACALVYDVNLDVNVNDKVILMGADGATFGAWIDASRSNGYNASDIITHPAYAIESLLRDELSLATADIDVVAFDAVGDSTTGDRVGWAVHGQLLDAETPAAVFADLLRSFACALSVDNENKLNLVALDRNSSPTRTLLENDLLATKDAELSYTPFDMVYNQFVVPFAYNADQNAYQKFVVLNESEFIINGSAVVVSNLRSGTPTTYTGVCSGSQSDYGTTQELRVETRWIRDETTALNLAKWLADWLTYRRRKVTLTVSYLHAIDLELLDQVNLKLDVATGVFIVTSWNINLRTDTMTLELLEMREL